MRYELRWRKGKYEFKKLQGHRGGVSCISLSGGFMVSGSADCDVLLWDLDTATCLGALKGHSQGVTCVIMNEEKDIVISGSMDGLILVHTLSTRTIRYTFNQHSSSILCINYQPKTDTLISGSGDYTARVFDLNTGTCQHLLVGHRGNIICIEANERVVVTGSKDGMAMIWSLETGHLLHKLCGHTDDIYCLALWRDLVVTGSLDCRIKLWKLDDGELLQTLQGHKADVLALQTCGNKIFSASVDRNIRMWIWNGSFGVKESESISIQGHTAAVELLAIGGPKLNFLISAGSDKTLRVWDSVTGANLFEIAGFEWVLSLQANESKIVVASASSGDISLISFDEPSTLASSSGQPPTRQPLRIRKKQSARQLKANCIVQ